MQVWLIKGLYRLLAAKKMTPQDIIDYCSKKDDAYIDYPFGEVPICFKVYKKVFCELYPKENDFKITLKCEPNLAVQLRQEFPGDIVRGYHCPPIQQPHRNTVYLNRSVPDLDVLKMIDHSYAMVMLKVKRP